jgi:hypothetical protein
MMKTTTLTLAAIMLAAVSASAQRELGGTWRLDESRSGSPTWAEFVRPVMRVIRLTSASVEIDVTEGTKTTTLRYPLTATKPAALDEAASSNRAYWDGERLITETVQSVNGHTVTMREELTLEADGKDLVVQRVVEVEHGYQFRGAKNNSMVRDIFVRVAP